VSSLIDLSQYFTAVKRFNTVGQVKATDMISGRFIDQDRCYLIDDILAIGKKNRATHVILLLREGATVWEDGFEPNSVYYILPFEDVNVFIERLSAEGVVLMKEIK